MGPAAGHGTTQSEQIRQFKQIDTPPGSGRFEARLVVGRVVAVQAARHLPRRVCQILVCIGLKNEAPDAMGWQGQGDSCGRVS